MEETESEKRKTELLEAADRLFRRRGVMETTINAIAREVHVAKGLFYYYFSSKDEVISAVSRKYCDRFAEELQNRNIQNEGKKDVLEFLLQAGGSFRRLWTSLQGENESIDLSILADRTMDEAREEAVLMLKDVLDTGRMDGSLRIRNTELWAKWMVGGIAELARDLSITMDEINYMINDMIDRM